MALSQKIRRTTLRTFLVFLAGMLCALAVWRLVKPFTRCVPKYAIYASNIKEIHFKHVMRILDLLGYERTNLNDDWHFLYAHEDPFPLIPQRMKQLKPNQIVNHIPGNKVITNKLNLSTSALPFMPLSFRLPQEGQAFLDYAQTHPKSLFVIKSNRHRQIRIRAPNNINLSTTDSFVQKFIDDPFLVDGHKFDFGVYVAVTSVNPLLVYMYTGDVMFRYCPIKYYPFDENIEHKYVIGAEYLPTWQMPALRKYYNCFGGNLRAAFEAYVRAQTSWDPAVIWPQVEHIIRQTMLAKESKLNHFRSLHKNGQFYELLRFDMILDNNFTVHLMEANMTPNMSSTQFHQLGELFEQILYSIFNLVNIGSPFKYSATKDCGVDQTENVVTSKRHLVTNITKCERLKCEDSCKTVDCRLCMPCFNTNDIEILKKAHREHFHRMDMKRLLPKPILDPEDFDIESEVKNMTAMNAWLLRWFHGKCQSERTWCN